MPALRGPRGPKEASDDSWHSPRTRAYPYAVAAFASLSGGPAPAARIEKDWRVIGAAPGAGRSPSSSRRTGGRSEGLEHGELFSEGSGAHPFELPESTIEVG